MPTFAQVNYLRRHNHLIREPILIIGSRLYGYDRFDFRQTLEAMGYRNTTGVDLINGPNVDYQLDICDATNVFILENRERFRTVICKSVLMYVPNPFRAAENIATLSCTGATLFLSEGFIHKVTNMPKDYWRFTPESLGEIFYSFELLPASIEMSLTRLDIVMPYNPNGMAIQRYSKHPHETMLGYWLRKLHARILASGVFRASRLFPEIAIFAIGIKR
jgi:hypothetical protein